jgi:2-polyprenyl-6-methoxyphenol hydroxylase-like FAD-dependent oxidoreductase
LAIIVENDLIQASLDKRVKDFKNIEILYSSQLKDILQEDGDFVKLKLNDGSFINTKLLIGLFCFL